MSWRLNDKLRVAKELRVCMAVVTAVYGACTLCLLEKTGTNKAFLYVGTAVSYLVWFASGMAVNSLEDAVRRRDTARLSRRLQRSLDKSRKSIQKSSGCTTSNTST
jgi:hypothetical protein